MKLSISEILDRYSICLLKRERGNADNLKELHNLNEEIKNYRKLNNDIINEYMTKFLDINSKIWDLESDIRRGKEGILGLEEVGKRAIMIRDLNKKRVVYKNELVEIFNEGYTDFKINHASS